MNTKKLHSTITEQFSNSNWIVTLYLMSQTDSNIKMYTIESHKKNELHNLMLSLYKSTIVKWMNK